MAFTYTQFIGKHQSNTIFCVKLSVNIDYRSGFYENSRITYIVCDDKGNNKYNYRNMKISYKSRNGFIYKKGVNQDSKGLYFTTLSNISNFDYVGSAIAIIELCKDSEYYTEFKWRYKTNKFIIKEIYNDYSMFLLDYIANDQLELVVSQYGDLIKYFEKINKIIKLFAEAYDIGHNGLRLDELGKPSGLRNLSVDELLHFNMIQHKSTLMYLEVINPSINLYMLALSKNGLLLEYVGNQTEELCKLAVEQNGLALKYVKHQTRELCDIAIRQNNLASKYIRI
jgi:hypothetical protein